MVGSMIFPVATSKLAVRVCVPWRVYSFLAAFDLAGLHGKNRVRVFQRLNAGFFVDADDMHALLMQFGRLLIDVTNGLYFVRKLGGIVTGPRRQPVAGQMWLKVGVLLKNVLRCGTKCWGQCRA